MVKNIIKQEKKKLSAFFVFLRFWKKSSGFAELGKQQIFEFKNFYTDVFTHSDELTRICQNLKPEALFLQDTPTKKITILEPDRSYQ